MLGSIRFEANCDHQIREFRMDSFPVDGRDGKAPVGPQAADESMQRCGLTSVNGEQPLMLKVDGWISAWTRIRQLPYRIDRLRKALTPDRKRNRSRDFADCRTERVANVRCVSVRYCAKDLRITALSVSQRDSHESLKDCSARFSRQCRG